MGLNPLSTTNNPLLSGFTSSNGQSYINISFTRDTAIYDLTATVQWSNDLLNWSNGSSYGPAGIVPTNAITTEVSRVLTGGIEAITVRANTPSSIGPQFLRVKVDGP